MALSQHPARLILIFTKKRKGSHGRVLRVHTYVAVVRTYFVNEAREKKIITILLVYLSNITLLLPRIDVFLITMSVS